MTLIDATASHDEADLIETLVLPLPIRVLTGMLGVPGEDRRTEHELTSMVCLLPITGHEATVTLIGTLVTHPEQLARSRPDETEEFELAGVNIPANPS
ncbi:hypothetical protein ALI22I_14985 [Saccharothrix sp. ALI-22-I]|uniref:hypothetical protein n=1 Tax=Saccharothrix sp. ALI-22-I TaxID=1933778 RepID=UPI00097C9255|nr:hypothetical protein [Saccharothrix sp. ALI-22-I]ONI89782.1 hypothetical protein ALI22I_14985 [Saccharothrix sp. ALI-22-I]